MKLSSSKKDFVGAQSRGVDSGSDGSPKSFWEALVGNAIASIAADLVDTGSRFGTHFIFF